MTWKFDGKPQKAIGHILYTISRFVHHFKAIGEFKLELQSGNAQFGSKLLIFCPLWPQNLTKCLENNRAHLLCYFKLWASFHNHLSIQNWVIVRKRQIWVKISVFCPVWPQNLTDDLEKLYGTPSMPLKALCIISWPSVKSKWSYSPETPNLGQNRWFFVPCDLEMLQMTLNNNRAPLLFFFMLCASFHSHLWIQNGVIVRKRSIWVKISDFFVLCGLEIWRMTLKNNRAPLLCYFNLYASFHSHLWIQNGVTVRKR